jgi:hypothetical protein
MENGKWKISGNNTKDGFGNQPNPTLSNVNKPHNIKNAKYAANARQRQNDASPILVGVLSNVW